MRLRSRKRSGAISLVRPRIHRTIHDRLAAQKIGDSVVKNFFSVIFAAFVSTNSFAAIVQEVSPQLGRPVLTNFTAKVRSELGEFYGRIH
jgi:hypothetical protein